MTLFRNNFEFIKLFFRHDKKQTYTVSPRLFGNIQSRSSSITTTRIVVLFAYPIDIITAKEYNYKHEYDGSLVLLKLSNKLGIYQSPISIITCSYDAWGVCTVTQDSVGIATVNPFRYRRCRNQSLLP